MEGNLYESLATILRHNQIDLVEDKILKCEKEVE
jgi:hypothetical protein